MTHESEYGNYTEHYIPPEDVVLFYLGLLGDYRYAGGKNKEFIIPLTEIQAGFTKKQRKIFDEFEDTLLKGYRIQIGFAYSGYEYDRPTELIIHGFYDMEPLPWL